MPEVPDLSKFAKDGDPDAPTTFAGLTDEEKAAIDAMTAAEEAEEAKRAAEEAAAQPISVTTAFLIVILPDGQIVATPDLNQNLLLHHEATPPEILGASAFIQADVVSGLTAQKTTVGIAQFGQAMQRQQQELALREQLARQGGPFRRA